MTDDGGTAILESLQFNSTLKTLDFSGNNLSEELVQKIQAELKSPNRYGCMVFGLSYDCVDG